MREKPLDNMHVYMHIIKRKSISKAIKIFKKGTQLGVNITWIPQCERPSFAFYNIVE
jgi:hypothetical protein